MIILDYQDRRPIYEQITEKFRMLIYQGALPAGCRDAADSGKKQRRFSKRISGTCQTWNQHRYDRRRTDDIGSERV